MIFYWIINLFRVVHKILYTSHSFAIEMSLFIWKPVNNLTIMHVHILIRSICNEMTNKMFDDNLLLSSQIYYLF